MFSVPSKKVYCQIIQNKKVYCQIIQNKNLHDHFFIELIDIVYPLSDLYPYRVYHIHMV